jgi:hypothetical protein
MGGALWTARAAKKVVETGKWQSGKMPKGLYPLSKNTSVRLGSGWEYCVHKLTGPNPMSLLIAFHPGKRNYLAWLALEHGNDQAILARFEHHSSHDGWHVHLKPDDLTQISWGVVKQQGEKRVICKAKPDPAVGKAEAEALAFRVFNGAPETWEMQQ